MFQCHFKVSVNSNDLENGTIRYTTLKYLKMPLSQLFICKTCKIHCDGKVGDSPGKQTGSMPEISCILFVGPYNVV